MWLARILDSMFDPEERKKQMEKAKEQAMARIKIPPLTGNHSKPGETTATPDLHSANDRYWLHVFLSSEAIRNKHGVSTVEGKWKITDQKLFEAKVDETKRFILRPHWKK